MSNWKTADDLAAELSICRTTVARCARGIHTWNDPRALRIERRKATAIEKVRSGRRIKLMYRLRAESDEQAHVELVEAVRSEPGAQHDRDIEIAWDRFAVTHEGVEYLSLRKMVDVGGLYAHFHKAKEALERTALVFTRSVENPGEQGGRPKEDCLLLPADAKEFAADAKTPTGRRIVKIIIAHSDELQAVRAGDEDATVRVLGSMPDLAPMFEHMERTMRTMLETTVPAMVRALVGEPLPQLAGPVELHPADVRKAFAAGIRMRIMETINLTGESYKEVAERINGYVKGAIGKPRPKWVLYDYEIGVQAFEEHEGVPFPIDPFKPRRTTARAAQLRLLDDGSDD